MLWGNGAILAGLLLGQTFSQQGLATMELGSIMSVDDMPYYYYTDEYGDQVTLPCTERYVNEPLAVDLISKGFMPVLSVRGRPEVRLASFVSLGGSTIAGPWAPIEIEQDEEDDAVDQPAKAEEAASPPAAEEEEPVAAAEDVETLDSVEEEPVSSDTHDEVAGDEPPEISAEPPEPAAEPPEPAAVSPDDTADELDALLAELEAEDADQAAGDDEGIDPELEALLADL
jgi:type VI secretion system protein ImpC